MKRFPFFFQLLVLLPSHLCNLSFIVVASEENSERRDGAWKPAPGPFWKARGEEQLLGVEQHPCDEQREQCEAGAGAGAGGLQTSVVPAALTRLSVAQLSPHCADWWEWDAWRAWLAPGTRSPATALATPYWGVLASVGGRR